MAKNIFKLKNGITLIHKRVKNVNGVAVNLIFKAGGYNDYLGKAGLAHFCEHVLMGFPTLTSTKQQRLEQIKNYVVYNAYTSNQIINFTLFTPKEDIESALDLMTDPFANIIINQEDFESEYKIIQDEIITMVKYNKNKALTIKRQLLSKNKELRNTEAWPAGSIETLAKIKIEDIKTFINEYFNKENLVVSVAGNITKREALRLIEKYINPRIKDNGRVGFDFNQFLGYKDRTRAIKVKPDEKGKAYLNLNYNYRENKSRYLDRYNTAIFNILSSVLYEQIFSFYRDKNNLCYGASGEFCYHNIYESVFITIECQQNNLQKIIDKFKELKTILSQPLDKNLFGKHKKKIIGMVNLDNKKVRNLAINLYSQYDQFGDILTKRESKKFFKKVKNITYEEANEIYQKFLKVRPIVTIVSEDDIKINFKDFYYAN